MVDLTARERLILQLRYADGWTFTEIAEGIGVSKSRISESHRNALNKLRACLSATNEAEWRNILQLYL